MRQIATFRRIPGSLLPSFAVFALAFTAHSFGVFDRLDARIHDGLLRGMPASPPAAIGSLPDATVVTIDPRSLRALEAWPWPRHRYAEAIDRLERAGAVAIASA
jgi:CHASE2 domain-containing sensor protein